MRQHTISLTFLMIILFISCTPTKNTDNTPIQLEDEVTISDIQEALANNEYNIVQLTQFYLDRIKDLSENGHQLNAVITVNPDAIEIAKSLDEEYQNNKTRGPLHGIPVLLKDNIDTGDKMPCTAGAIPMKDSYPLEDSPVAAQLREAGAIILGKANMSEWANFHSNVSSSGWSALGGQVKNPYELTSNPCGSSSGSAVGVAANLCVIAIGTETNGSIICPSHSNGIVGIKPTVGLISRRGIIPISDYHDTSGPMARTVKDVAIALGTMTDMDEKDEKTLDPARKAYTDYVQFLKSDGLKGKRIGYYSAPLENDSTALSGVMNEAIDYFKEQGAIIIDVDSILQEGTGRNSFMVMQYEFKNGLNDYLKGLGNRASVENLEEIVAITFADSIEMKYHGHELLKLCQTKGDLDAEEYTIALTTIMENSRTNGIDRVMDANQLDAIIAPSGSPAWKTDLENGDTFGIFSSSPAAISGYPSITVPMGKIGDLPVGISIFGRAWSEPLLLEIAYSYEQGTNHRFSPAYLSGK